MGGPDTPNGNSSKDNTREVEAPNPYGFEIVTPKPKAEQPDEAPLDEDEELQEGDQSIPEQALGTRGEETRVGIGVLLSLRDRGNETGGQHWSHK